MPGAQPNARTVKILVVDDDEDDFFIIRELAEQVNSDDFSIQLSWCQHYEPALSSLCSGAYDIYFIDYRLGAKTGLDLIGEAMKKKCSEPIILLTGKGNREIDLQAMRAGAADYLVKSDLNPEKIERCIRYAMTRATFLKTIQANEQKYRGLFEKSRDCIFIAGTDLHILEINQLGSELLGYNPRELLQKNVKDLVAHPEQTHALETALTEKGIVLDFEMALLTKDKNLLNTIVSISRETDETGQVYLQGIIHDITSLKKAERVTLQTEKLKSAERLVRMLAHEVRNPLNNILLATDQLNQSCANEPGQQIYLQIINRNSSRINNIVTELMDASRSGEIKKATCTLESLLDASLLAAADRITLKRMRVEKNFHGNQSWIMADSNKLKIAFLNIIINALEAAPEGSGLLTIGVQPTGSAYQVIIADNGHGIKEEDVSRIFDPYYTSKNNGMGLGLASVLNIIRSHGAQLEVKSTLGEGTSFIIHFEKVNP